MINGSLSMSALYHSSIGTVAANGCIRPVVTLNSEIQIEEGIGDGKTAETAWKLIKQ